MSFATKAIRGAFTGLRIGFVAANDGLNMLVAVRPIDRALTWTSQKINQTILLLVAVIAVLMYLSSIGYLTLAPERVALEMMRAQEEAARQMRLERDSTCVALAIYYEARNQPRDGQIAVAHVVRNRAADASYKGDPCRVVFREHKHGNSIHFNPEFAGMAKFSFDVPAESDAWAAAKEVAAGVLRGRYPDPTGGATFFHTAPAPQKWQEANNNTCGKQIADHTFCWELPKKKK